LKDLTLDEKNITESNLTTDVKSIEQCEEQLKRIGLNQDQIKSLNDTIEVLGDIIFDNYFKEFYD
jgi:hypothetical protein